MNKILFPFGTYVRHINHSPKAPEETGLVSSGTINSFTVTGSTWVPGAHKNKVVKIFKDAGVDFCFGLVYSNTEDTIVFDDDLLTIPCSSCEYSILDTLIIEEKELPNIVAIDIRNHSTAVVLPEVTSEIERYSIHCYIERGDSNINSCAIIGRKTDYQLGAKCGTLDYIGEAVTLYAHTWDLEDSSVIHPHWDIVNTYNIQRGGFGWFIENEPANTTVYTPIGSKVDYDIVRRFTPITRTDINYLRYTSLLTKIFTVSIDLTIEKTGATGDISFSIAKRKTDGTLEISDRVVDSEFGGATGIQSISLTTPVELNRNEELVIVSKKTGGTFNVLAGSSINITQI